MILGNQVEWALHCCAILSALGPEDRVSTQKLAEFHGVPKEYLSKGLQHLARAELINGTIGPTGGYRLSRAPSEITFLDIVEAIEGRTSTFKCTEIRANNPCLKNEKLKGICAVAQVMYRADEAWREELRKTTLLDLAGVLMKTLDKKLLERGAEFFRAR